MTRYEKLINGTKEDLVAEFISIIKWARSLPVDTWNCLMNGQPGLDGLVREVLDVQLSDITKEPTRNKYNCKHAHRTYDDIYGAEYYCTLYHKDCDSCV